MRINKYLAQATGLSRRRVDQLLAAGQVTVNGQTASLGQQITPDDQLSINGKQVDRPPTTQTVLFNKPVGYVCSRRGQGSQTIYDLLPAKLHHLKPVGRLDKDSSGLLLLTNDGQLANQLTHPSYVKNKFYQIVLDQPLGQAAQNQLTSGVQLDDGPSRLQLKSLSSDDTKWQVIIHEGRNRQIRRSFAATGHTVTALRRTQLGPYRLNGLPIGQWQAVTIEAAQRQPLPPKS